jgi:hypothetical protein
LGKSGVFYAKAQRLLFKVCKGFQAKMSFAFFAVLRAKKARKNIKMTDRGGVGVR